MQLGDWVEFESIVGKEVTAAGMRPVAQTLPQPRRGIIVGSRQVYEVLPGSPPTLRNPVTVLLIAVSIGRCYRVFPQDARPSAPATRRRGLMLPGMTHGAAATPLASTPVTHGAATGATVPLQMTHAPGGRRVPVTQAALELLVADAINGRLATGAMFTAYEVTQDLRAAHPAFDLRHDQVRPVVHAQMEALVASGLYDRECADFGVATALRYLPA
jgi:hypothetical protein